MLVTGQGGALFVGVFEAFCCYFLRGALTAFVGIGHCCKRSPSQHWLVLTSAYLPPAIYVTAFVQQGLGYPLIGSALLPLSLMTSQLNSCSALPLSSALSAGGFGLFLLVLGSDYIYHCFG